MALLSFNYHSKRAKKARFAVKLKDKFIRVLLYLLVVMLLVLGVLLLYYEMSIGWFVISLVSPPITMLYWYKKDLYRLEPSDESIDGLMSSSVLGLLPNNPTAQDVVNAVSNVSSGRFLAARFGIGPGFLKSLVENSSMKIEDVWKYSAEIKNELGSKMISGGILTLAVVKSTPNHENLLARLQFDFDDLKDGVNWHDHLYELVQRSRIPMRTGGLARDWSFGFTPLLNRFGRNISMQISASGGRRMSADLPSHEQVITKMVDMFSSGGRQNIALVGPDGVGKTSVVHAFAERLLDASSKISNNLKFRQVFLLDSASLISAAPGKGELEALINQILVEAFSAKNIILCLDNAQLFFEEGVGSVDLTNVLLPILEAGRVRMILTVDEQKLLKIGQKNPALINSLNRINIKPANYKETLAAMEDSVVIFEHQNNVTYMYQSLKKAYDLSERYIYDLAQPGRAIRLLQTSANYSDGGLVTASSVEQAIERTIGVKVGVASLDSEKEKLLNLEDLIHKRMVNQKRAVKVVSDALRRARTGVRNQNRPIGTFLFLGPTGVGKTELAKALAEVYFNGEDNLVRVDLNQYVTLENVSDLTADGANNPNSLTAQMMKRPFSVVLLDEIEKAHPNVLTALLQVLDEGVLRDAKNREVSFKDSIVIATSNASSDRIREFIERGYDINQFEEQLTNELISSKQFRPEFLNRFDEIVFFRPLEKPELRQIADLIIASVNKTLATQKITVDVTPEAKDLLVEAGYDPRLGARPMRRVVQRTVENHVAKIMLSGSAASGSTITINENDVRDSLEQ